MLRHGMGTATPGHMEQTGDDGKHSDMNRGTESHLRKQSLSHVCTQSHTRHNKQHRTSLHVGFQAVTWRHLQPALSRTAGVHREGTFSQGIHEDVQSRVVAHGNLEG